MEEKRQVEAKAPAPPEVVVPERMPDLHKFQMPEPMASQTALVASLIEGTHRNETYNFVAARNAQPVKSIEDWVRMYQSEYLKRPATEMDVTPEGIQRAEMVVGDYRVALSEAIVARAATLPESPDIDANSFNINRHRARDIPYIADGLMGMSEELDTAKLQYLMKFPEHAGLYGRNPEVLGSIYDTSVGVGGEFIPARGAVDFWNWAVTAKEMGILDGWVDTVVASVIPGNMQRKVREHLATLPGPEQAKFFTDFLGKYEAKIGPLATNFHMFTMMQGIASDEFIHSMEPEDRLDFWMTNIAAIGAWAEAALLGTVVGAGLGYGVGKGTRATHGAAQLLWRSRPSAGARNLAHLVQNFSEADLAKRWGISKMEVIQSQLPGPAIDAEYRNLPDGILNEIDLDRVGEASEVAADIARRQNANIFTTDERLGIMSRVGADLEELHGSAMRPSMSRVEVFDDESGVRFSIMAGKDNTHGFSDLNEALDYARRFGDERSVEFYRLGRDGSTLEKFVPKVKRDADGGWVFDGTPPAGEFFVNLKHDHYFSPLDATLFGGDPVVAGTWMGRFARALTTPSAHLNKEVYKKFGLAYTREQSLNKALDSITAPMFRELTNTDRRKVNDIMYWAEEFGTKEGRTPTYLEVRAQFPEFEDKVLGGYYQTQLFYDTVHSIQNQRLYRAWHNQGYKTATNGTASYHGAVLSKDEVLKSITIRYDDGTPVTRLKPKSNEFNTVLDAKTGETIKLTDEELVEVYANGGTLMRLDLPVESIGDGAQAHRHVLVSKESGFKVRELSKYPLKKIPGYFTRMYEDAHYVTRTNLGAKVDGRAGRVDDVMAVAPTRAEADRYVARQIDKLGAKLYKGDWDNSAPRVVKEAKLREKGYEIRVTPDSRLETIDRAAIDSGKFKAEGRLFFDNRNPEPLRNIHGDKADALDPINTIQRVSRMVARQVSMEDLVQTQKNQFFETYKGRIPELNELSEMTTSRVSERLAELLRQSSGEQGRLVNEARMWWEHIAMMEGSMAIDVSGFRKLTINAAEWFDRTVGGGKYSPKAIRPWTRGLSRNADRVDVFRGLKSLAFLRFMTARPIRQLFLQGLQHFNIQAIDATYAGRWQMDTLSLLSAVRRLSNTREGRKLFRLKQKQDAKMLGYSDEEFNILLKEFEASGLVPKVDLHTYAGGMPKTAAYTPQTKLGRATQNVAGGAALPFQKMRQYGFDLGEQFNITASYLMALRRHKKETGITDLRKFTREDWDEVAHRGNQYGMAMDRSNSAPWQYGGLSNTLQFWQFTHKWMLTMMGASKQLRKAGLANQAFTVSEARKIVAGQVLLFSSGAFGISNIVKQLEQKYEVEFSDEQRQVIVHGLYDYVLDAGLRALADDPDLDLAWDDMFNPSGGIEQSIRTFGEAAFDNKHWEFLGGPGAKAASEFWKSAHTFWTLSGGQIEGMSENEKAQLLAASIASGFLVSGSDYLKIRMAQKAGQWTTSSGEGLGPNFEAKFEELMAKGLLGVNPQAVIDKWDAIMAEGDMERAIRSDARDAFNHITRIHALLENGRMTREELISQSNLALSALTVYDEKERALYIEELYSLMANATAEQDDLFTRHANYLARGAYPDFITNTINSPMFTEEERQVLKSMLEDAMNESEAWTERERDIVERNIENLRGNDRE